MKFKAILAALLLSVSAISFAAEVNPAPASAPAAAQVTVAKKPQKKSALMEFLPIIIMVVVMIFLFSRSNKKQAQKRMEMLDRIVKGTRVILTNGVYGKIVEVRENTFIVEVAENVRVEVIKNGIASNEDEEAEKIKAAKEKAEAKKSGDAK